MRPDVAGLRTWWLAALAVWALATWIATLGGIGGRLPVMPAAGNAAVLPAVPAAGTGRLGPVNDYADATARPLFTQDRRPHPFFLGEGGQPPAGSVRLTGVLMTPGMDMAILTTDQGQSLRLRLGAEPVGGWQLLSLEPRSAVVTGPAGSLNLELQIPSGAESRAADATSQSTAPTAPSLPITPHQPPADPAAASPNPSDAEIRAIRDRIQARRKQAQQHQNGSSGSQNP